MRLIDADAMITYEEFDELTGDYINRTMTIRELLNMVTEEGCPMEVEAKPVKIDWHPVKWIPLEVETKSALVAMKKDYGEWEGKLPRKTVEVLVTVLFDDGLKVISFLKYRKDRRIFQDMWDTIHNNHVIAWAYEPAPYDPDRDDRASWIKHQVLWQCSKCGQKVPTDVYNYCPNCGKPIKKQQD